MYKMMKFSLAAALTCYAISYVGFRLGGVDSDKFPETVIMAYAKDEAGGKQVEIKRDIEVKGVEDLDVQVTSLDLTLSASPDDKVHVEIKGVVSTDKLELQAEQSGKKLVIALKEKNRNIGIFHFNNDSGAMIVKVPATIKSADFKTVSADIVIDNLQLKRVGAETVSGSMDLKDAAVEEVKWNTVSGDWKSNSALSKFVAESVSGDFHIVSKTAYPDIKANSTSGDMSLKFAGLAPDIKLEFSTTSGDVDVHTSQLNHEGGKDFHSQLGAGKGSVSFESVSGDLTIRQ